MATTFWADDTAPAGSGTLGWINYGVLGLLIIGLIAGVFWVKPGVDNLKEQVRAAKADRDAQVKEMREERDKALAQRDAMAETFQREWLPMLTRFLAASEAMLPLMQRVIDRDRYGGER